MTIGITGGIGSGKSTVAKVLESMGYPVFYSDSEAKKIMVSDHDLQQEIIAYFGEESYKEGQLNRAFLAKRIFSNPEDKSVLNQLIHPRVRQRFTEFAESSSATLVFNEAAILFETGAYTNFDATLLVTASVETRIERVMNRDNCSRQDVLDRMKNQWEDERKIPLANYVINNDNHDRVLDQIETIKQQLIG